MTVNARSRREPARAGAGGASRASEPGVAAKPGATGSWRKRRAGAAALGGLGGAALVAAALAGGAAPAGARTLPAATAASSRPAATSSAVTFAEPAATTPNYIFPMMPSAVGGDENANFQYLMYRPLYSFGQNGQPVMNTGVSIAAPPVYSDGDKVVTIDLKHWNWSDGAPITARDVTFWINLLKANKANYYNYVPGDFPDDLASMTTKGDDSVVLTLTKAVTPEWFTSNELTQLIPLPQHAWDRTSASGPIGNYDATTSGAVAVWKFLNAESSKTSTYGSSPLWKVVSGPYEVTSLTTQGRATFTANTAYSGQKPRISTLIWEPFTSEAAEFNAVLAGSVDYGYVPLDDAPTISRVTAAGYRIDPWPAWSINYMELNFNNPVTGPLVHQLYLRQALQHLIDQPGYVSAFLHGYGYPTYGPIPVKPPNPYTTLAESSNPYPYDPSAAAKLLAAHGWTKGSSGVLTCQHPGSGSSDCGAGIKSGAPLTFNLMYTSGSTVFEDEATTFQQAASGVGVKINLSSAPFGTVIDHALPCTPKQSSCSGQIQYWGQGWIFEPDYYPSGENFFAGGAALNSSNYDDPTANKLIESSITGGGLGGYESYISKQVPVLWMPVSDSQISAIKTSLLGVGAQNPILTTTPETWYFSKCSAPGASRLGR